MTKLCRLAALLMMLILPCLNPTQASYFVAKETHVQKDLFVDISGYQKLKLADSFNVIRKPGVRVIAAELKIKSLEDKARIFVEASGVRTAYPIAVSKDLGAIKIPLPKNLQSLEDVEIVFKGKFYLEKVSLRYKQGPITKKEKILDQLYF